MSAQRKTIDMSNMAEKFANADMPINEAGVCRGKKRPGDKCPTPNGCPSPKKKRRGK